MPAGVEYGLLDFLVCSQSSWSALSRPGLLSVVLVCSQSSWSALSRPGLLSVVLVCSQSSWSALSRPGLLSVVLVCSRSSFLRVTHATADLTGIVISVADARNIVIRHALIRKAIRRSSVVS